MTPLAKGETKLVRARSSQRSRSKSDFLLTIAWKVALISRACTSDGAPRSIAATTTVSDLESPSRPIVIRRAMVHRGQEAPEVYVKLVLTAGKSGVDCKRKLIGLRRSSVRALQ